MFIQKQELGKEQEALHPGPTFIYLYTSVWGAKGISMQAVSSKKHLKLCEVYYLKY